MKYLKNVPYLRLWANSFIFQKNETFKDFIIDFLIWLFVTTGFIVGLYFVYTISGYYFRLLICLAIYFLLRFPIISLVARRFYTIGSKWSFCFFIFIPMGVFWSIFVCLFSRSEEESNGKNYRKRVKTPFIIGTILSPSIVIVPLVSLLTVVIAKDLFLPPETVESSFDIEKYEYYRDKIRNADEMLPTLEDVGDPVDKEFAYRLVVYNWFIGFCSDGISLFLDYTEESYQTEKNKVLSNYSFIDSPKKDNSGYWQFPVDSFTYKNYFFKIAPKYPYWTTSDDYCCKSFTMLGLNDEKKSIAYLYFYDFDIDYLAEPSSSEEYKNSRMQSLIETAFFWRQS